MLLQHALKQLDKVLQNVVIIVTLRTRINNDQSIGGKHLPRRITRRSTRRRRTRITRREPLTHNYKFTRLVRTVIYKALEARLPVSRAVELSGISFVTYREWMKRGKEVDQPIYATFRRKVKMLQVQHEREALEIINRVAKGGYKVTETKVTVDAITKKHAVTRKVQEALPRWQAAAWYLERRHREDYGRDVVDVLGKKTPAEIAAEIKEEADMIFASVPSAPDASDPLSEAVAGLENA